MAAILSRPQCVNTEYFVNVLMKGFVFILYNVLLRKGWQIFIRWGIATNGRPCRLPYHCRDNLGMRPANERQRYIVTSSLIGRAHTQNDPYIAVCVEGCRLVTIGDLLKWIFARLYNWRMLCPLCHVYKQSLHRIFFFRGDLRGDWYTKHDLEVSSMATMMVMAMGNLKSDRLKCFLDILMIFII